MLQLLDREKLKSEFAAAKPFPCVKIDNFIDPAKADAIIASYPSFEAALSEGQSFATVNERKKVQISDASKYAGPVKELNDLLASQAFLDDLSYITGIPNLLACDRPGGPA